MITPHTKLAIIGLGYVGLPLAVEFGKHRPVIGFDINEERVAELKSGYDRTREVGSAELAIASNLIFTTDFSEISNATVYIVTCLLYTSPSPRDLSTSRMPSSA